MNSAIIDISGVFCHEGFTFLPSIDLKELEGTNCYCSSEAAAVLRRRLSEIPLETACWIDTGDYHYLSYFRGCQIKEPFELILLDNHTDDFDDSECLSCGNWVTALKRDTNCIVNSGADSSLPVFLSIDLDVLRPEDFRTNWDQGTMTFEELLDTIRRIFATRRVLAVDICGGKTESKGAMTCELDLNLTRRMQLLSLLNSL